MERFVIGCVEIGKPQVRLSSIDGNRYSASMYIGVKFRFNEGRCPIWAPDEDRSAEGLAAVREGLAARACWQAVNPFNLECPCE